MRFTLRPRKRKWRWPPTSSKGKRDGPRAHPPYAKRGPTLPAPGEAPALKREDAEATAPPAGKPALVDAGRESNGATSSGSFPAGLALALVKVAKGAGFLDPLAPVPPGDLAAPADPTAHPPGVTADSLKTKWTTPSGCSLGTCATVSPHRTAPSETPSDGAEGRRPARKRSSPQES